VSGPRFLRPERPRVSIVVVTFGGLDWTHRCLDALVANTPRHLEWELVVVVNPAGERTEDFLRDDDIALVVNDRNVGFAAACNRGALHARAPLLLFLNNDALVQPNWLPPLLETADEPGVGAVGATLLHLDGRMQQAGAILFRDGGAAPFADYEDAASPIHTFRRTADFGAAACLLVKSEAFAALGGFDAIYGAGYYEDADLCLALAAGGWRTVYEPRSIVLHARGVAGGQHLGRLVAHNQAVFAERWREVLDNRPRRPPERPDSSIPARDASAAARLLVVADGSEHAEAIATLLARIEARTTWLGTPPATPPPAEVEVMGLPSDWEVWCLERPFLYDAILGELPPGAAAAVGRWQQPAAQLSFRLRADEILDRLVQAGIAVLPAGAAEHRTPVVVEALLAV
jgi:GT2 family glycosyltransferase